MRLQTFITRLDEAQMPSKRSVLYAMKNWLMHGGDFIEATEEYPTDTILDDFENETGVNVDGMSTDPAKEKRFEDWLHRRFIVDFEEVSREVADNIQGNEITLYRGVYLNYSEIIRLTEPIGEPIDLGTFWSYDQSAAQAYYPAGRGREYLFTGRFQARHVNLPLTIAANLVWGEKEVRFRRGEIPCELVSVKDTRSGEITTPHPANQFRVTVY